MGSDLLKRLWQEETGQDMVEYGLLLTLIGMVAIVSIKTVGNVIKNVFGSAATNLSAAS
jgi:pilus assembly protein Flp/PilA